jgi:FlaA1/EpsC-like NDP-sugar epimerase
MKAVRTLKPAIYYSRAAQMILDASVFAIACAAAYLIRFEGIPPGAYTKQCLLWLPCFVGTRVYISWRLGVYRFIWRYVALPDATVIARSLFFGSMLLLGLRFIYPSLMIFAHEVRVPVGVIASEYLLSLTGTLGLRALRRISYQQSRKSARRPADVATKRVILFGAGDAGILLARDLSKRPDVKLAGFLDDDPRKQGFVISGLKVLGDSRSLERIVRQHAVEQLVISIATPEKELLNRIVSQCRAIRVPVKIIPSLQEMYLRDASIGQVRDVQAEDLLGRAAVQVAERSGFVRQMYAGARILVTGAGGSIGREIVRQLLQFHPASIVILDKDENAIYELQQELLFAGSTVLIEPRIADIRHRNRLEAIFAESRPSIVLHAAAHKHVPMMEINSCEAILNNVGGTETLLRVCQEHALKRFIYISSDKAVNPTNVMGATKRIGELLVRDFARSGQVPAACVRFGNVLGSRGSVIPLFQQQIARGGPVTITHPEVVRYFMTVPEAVHLVLCAGSLASRGETFVLDMGNPRKILDVATELEHFHK